MFILASQGAAAVTASGGSETTVGNYKYHIFSTPGTSTLTVTGSGNMEVLLIGGGGGGGIGGGGAGGVYQYPTLNVPTGTHNVVVGGGGSGGSGGSNGANGGASSFRTLTADGGGYGGGYGNVGGNGGSGGGGGTVQSNGGSATGNGVGNAGGKFTASNAQTGGGGGASAVGTALDGGQGVNISSYWDSDTAGLSVFSGMSVVASGGGGTGECNGFRTNGTSGYQGIAIIRYRIN